jgi:CxxC motif-containing protein (DUF1111 family)
MRMQQRLLAAFIAIAGLGLWTAASAMFPNIFSFTQNQDATSTPGKLIITYMPDLSETPSTTPYVTPNLAGADITWINNSMGQTCNSGQMQHVSAKTFKFTVDAAPGDTIDYFFTQRWVGISQHFYPWMPEHQSHNVTDTKWFTYIMGKGFEQKPAWPLVVEGSERPRNRHEGEWRFDHFIGDYYQNIIFDFKLIDWGDSLLLFMFPSQPTNWAIGRFFGMSGYEILCDHDTYGDNRGSGDNQPPGGVFDKPTDIAGLGMVENPFQKNWAGTGYNLKWYVWMVRGLSYGQYIDFELSAARTFPDGQLYYSEPQRYYPGLGRMDNKFQHPWARPAGQASVNTVTYPEFAFSQHVQNARPGNSGFFMKGKAFFDTDWKTGMLYNYATPFDCNGSPMAFPDSSHSPLYRPGTSGPLYKTTSCFGCHYQDGKGYPETGQGTNNAFGVATFVNLQVADSNGKVGGHPVFGASLQVNAYAPYQPQGKCNVTWVDGPGGTYGDNTQYKLRKPSYSFSNLGYGVTTMDGVRISPRFIPHLSGLGMLEAVDENTILSFVNMSAKAGTGIAGKPQRVNDTFKGQNSLGRFGWKAGLASLKTEVYTRVASDLGISNSRFTDIVPPSTTPDAPKISDACIDTLIMYVSLLAPAPRQLGKAYIVYDPKIKDATVGGAIWADSTLYKGEAFEEIWKDPSAIRGKKLFTDAKCDLCHVPAMRTGINTQFEELKNLEIQPFTDLLLHDMGPELADNGYIEGIAGSAEWRTPPLWGLMYVPYVNGHTCYLHDGRARSIEEAILWHYGEGSISRQAFLKMSSQERTDLLRYADYPFADRLPRSGYTGVALPAHGSKIAGTMPALYCLPNPVRNAAIFRLVNVVGSDKNDVRLEIFNMKGQTVFSQAVRPHQTLVKWDATRYTSGKYIARLVVSGKMYKKDVIVMR